MTINERFFHLLSESGISQKQFSQMTGISEKTISNWKTRGNNPPTEYIATICEVFGVSYSFFLTGIDEENKELRNKLLLADFNNWSKEDRDDFTNRFIADYLNKQMQKDK